LSKYTAERHWQWQWRNIRGEVGGEIVMKKKETKVFAELKEEINSRTCSCTCYQNKTDLFFQKKSGRTKDGTINSLSDSVLKW